MGIAKAIDMAITIAAIGKSSSSSSSLIGSEKVGRFEMVGELLGETEGRLEGATDVDGASEGIMEIVGLRDRVGFSEGIKLG